MSPRLALHFLGTPLLQMDAAPVLIDRRSGVALLAYLAVEDLKRTGQHCGREFLSGLLWPDYDQTRAYSNLRHTLWEIHRSMGDAWITANHTSVGMSAEAHISVDISRFQELVSQCRQESDMSQRIPLLIEAARLYRNHFLTGFSLRGASEFNEWTYSQAENYRNEMIEALNMLVEDTCVSDQADVAIPYARRLVAFDPLNEAAQLCSSTRVVKKLCAGSWGSIRSPRRENCTSRFVREKSDRLLFQNRRSREYRDTTCRFN
jgi:DNA-binding SARP family transcriptional activator